MSQQHPVIFLYRYKPSCIINNNCEILNIHTHITTASAATHKKEQMLDVKLIPLATQITNLMNY